MRRMLCRSAPEQKQLPAACRMTTRIFGSLQFPSSCLSSSRIRFSFRALRVSGLFRVSLAIPLLCSKLTRSDDIAPNHSGNPWSLLDERHHYGDSSWRQACFVVAGLEPERATQLVQTIRNTLHLECRHDFDQRRKHGHRF